MTQTWAAIPGQPAKRMPVPKLARAKAEKGIAALTKAIADKQVFGFLDPPAFSISTGYAGHDLHLSINAPSIWHRDDMLRKSPYRTIGWSWCVLWQDDTWEEGWHPDAIFWGLKDEWKANIRAAMAGKTSWTIKNI